MFSCSDFRCLVALAACLVLAPSTDLTRVARASKSSASRGDRRLDSVSPSDRFFPPRFDPTKKDGYGLQMAVLEQGNPKVDPCLDQVMADVECATLRQLPPRPLSDAEERLVIPAIIRTFDNLSPKAHPHCPVIDPCVINSFTLDKRIVTDTPCDAPRLTYDSRPA